MINRDALLSTLKSYSRLNLGTFLDKNHDDAFFMKTLWWGFNPNLGMGAHNIHSGSNRNSSSSKRLKSSRGSSG